MAHVHAIVANIYLNNYLTIYLETYFYECPGVPIFVDNIIEEDIFFHKVQ